MSTEETKGTTFMDTCGDENYNWYPEIKPWTFETVFLHLSLDEATALRKYKELINMFLAIKDFSSRVRGQWDNETYAEIEPQVIRELDDEQKRHLSVLVTRLDDAIKPFVEKGGAAFIKLSARSPKDAAFFGTEIKDLLKADIEHSTVTPGSPECDIEDVILFTRNISRCLAVHSGQEAVRLLTRSKRVLADITGAELMSQNKGFNISMIVREWDESILPEWEFRVFVQNNKLTAATQYNYICYVPEMVPIEENIKKCIYDFWLSVKNNISAKTYTLDLALRPDLTNTKIIEINNPPPAAGSSLFDWNVPEDRKQIEQGPDFVLRILKKMPEGAKDKIHQPIRRYIDFVRGVAPLELVINHTHLSCNMCCRLPITKTWYQCETCDNYDLCMDCYNERRDEHKGSHVFKQAGEKMEEIEETKGIISWCSVL